MAGTPRIPTPARIAKDPQIAATLAKFRQHGLDATLEDAADDDMLRLLWRASHVPEPARSAAGYPRLSLAKKSATATEVSIGQQVKDICKTALALNWQITDWYVDYESASSFAVRTRKEFTRMLGDLEDGTIDAVAAYYLDRAFRMGADLEPVLRLAEAGRCEVATSTGLLNLREPGGRMTARLLVMMATYESETISRRQKAHAVELARRGAFPGGRRPYGFVTVSGNGRLPSLEQVPEEAEIIRELYEQILTNGWAISASVRWLDAQRDAGRVGAATVNGGPWRRKTLRQILCGSYIAGLREHAPTRVEPVPGDSSRRRRVTDGDPTRYPALWTGIVSPGELDAMRALLGADERRTTPTGAKARSQALTGYVVCECGNKMYSGYSISRDGSKVPRYGCGRANGGCGRVARASAKLERLARDLVIAALADQRVQAAAVDGAVVDDPRPISAIQAELETVEDQRTRMAASLGEGHISIEAFEAFNTQASERAEGLRAELTAKLEESIATSPPVLGNGDAVARLWDEGTPLERNELMGASGIMLRVSRIGRGHFPDTAGIEVLDAAEFKRQERERRRV